MSSERMRFSSASAMPARVAPDCCPSSVCCPPSSALRVMETGRSPFCNSIIISRRSESGFPPPFSFRSVSSLPQAGSKTDRDSHKRFLNSFIVLYLFCLSFHYSSPLSASSFIILITFLRFFLAFSGSVPAALRNHSAASSGCPERYAITPRLFQARGSFFTFSI